MRQLLFLLGLFTIVCGFTSDSLPEYPQDYFRSPVNHPIRLSGTFGELRPNHFHAGIDIKPLKGVGDPILAVAEGYVSRVKVSSRGYGNCLYINHPNGYTSVYAHLKEFPDSLAAYIKKLQYERQTFEIELFPDPYVFNFQKGEQIGKLGISGRSFGPHLHFEIRDSRTERPINPLLFGLKVADTVKPKLHQLKVYSLDPDLQTLSAKKYNLTEGKSNYYISGDTLVVGAWRVGLALKAFDHMNGVTNWNGPFSIQMSVDDIPTFSFQMETFDFEETRYLNAHLDYKERLTKKSYFHRCFRLPGNRLSIYDEPINEGVIPLEIGRAKKVEFLVKDVAGNEAKLRVFIRRGKVTPTENNRVFNYIIPYDAPASILTGGAEFHFPEGSFYETTYLHYHSSAETSSRIYSDIHSIGEKTTPVHKNFDIRILPNDIPEEVRDKALIARCQDQNLLTSLGGKWENGMLVARTRTLGDYCITTDITPPTITPLNVKSVMGKGHRMTFRIKDDFSGLKSYSATVDGEWILMEFDEKNALLYHKFDGSIPKGKHSLVVTITDMRDNVKTYKKEFTN